MAISITAVVLLAAATVVFGGGGIPASVLTLERAFPVNERVGIEVLRERDRVRHYHKGRFLQGFGGVADFAVQGTSDPYIVGLYFTKVRLGTPPREFNVQIDTGSDILWVTCSSCSDCPQISGLGIQLHFFDTSSSYTAQVVSCSDPICAALGQTASSGCSIQTNQCSFSFQYGDGSGTSGFYVSDMLHFGMVTTGSTTVNSSAQIVFGCSTYQSGDLTKSERAIDGIFGFGQHSLSVISQLSSRGVTPKVFSHCLKGEGSGGGILVLGEILDPSIVYSPLVPSQPHYNLNLRSITVNGQAVPIDPAVFATSNSRGAIVDSGTTLAYLVEEAYDPFVSAITAFVGQSATPTIAKGGQCYLTTASVDTIFPTTSLNFAGGADMILKPQEYLIHFGFSDGAPMWCLGFQKVQGQGVTILGDLVLKDKIFVYDLDRQRIGWANYDSLRAIETKNHTELKGKTIRVMWSHRDSDARKSGAGNVFVKNLCDSIDSAKLKEMFESFGNISSCKVAVTEDGKSKGYGFVQFVAEDSANAAIEKSNGTTVGGKQIYVGKFLGKSDRIASNPDLKYINLYMKNLDSDISEETLKEKFSQFGKIVSLAIAKDENGASKGFAFVNYENSDDAMKAMEAMNGSQLGSKILYVGRAQKQAEREQILRRLFQEKRMERVLKCMGSNVYIKNIHDDVTDEELRELFSKSGTIISAKIMRDEKGISKGLGFVCYSSPSEATNAVSAFQGYMCRQKPLYVAIAQRKEDRQAQLQIRYAHRIAGFPGPSAHILPGGYPPVFYAPAMVSQVPPGQGLMYQAMGMRPAGWRGNGFGPAARPSPVPMKQRFLMRQKWLMLAAKCCVKTAPEVGKTG